MTTADMTLPGKAAVLLMALAEKRARKARGKATARTRSLGLVIARATLQLAGFSMLTIAGYHLSFVAGCVVAALSLFLVSWLLTGMSSTTDDNPQQPHPATVDSRR